MSVYLRAAKAVDKKNLESCVAIAREKRLRKDSDVTISDMTYVKPYKELFSPEVNAGAYWLVGALSEHEFQQWRVLALLFMHWHETTKD